jgi:hypothetical protein
MFYHRRRSQPITLVLVGAGILMAMASRGCNHGSYRHHTFYDRNRQIVPRNLWIGPNGQPAELYDASGNRVPPNEVQAAYTQSTYSRSSSRRYGGGFLPLFFGGSRYGGSYNTNRSSYSTRSSSPVIRGGFGLSGFASS